MDEKLYLVVERGDVDQCLALRISDVSLEAMANQGE
jgi:hypothetical protein